MAKRKVVQIYDVNSVEAFMHDLRNALNFPFVDMYHSILGGPEDVSILLSFSIDPKETWPNGYFDNSRSAKIHIDRFGVTKQFSGYRLKLRKFTGKSPSHIAEKLHNIKVVV